MKEGRQAAIIDYRGSWNIGAYGLSTDKFTIFGSGFRARIIEDAKAILNVPLIVQNIMGEPIIGITTIANSYGILVPPQTLDSEIKILEKELDIPVARLEFKTYDNALGNIILANDRTALLHIEIAEKNRSAINIIEDVLNVEVATYPFSFPIIGTAVVANNKGALAHPSMNEEELEFIKDTMRVRVGTGTVNTGSPYIRSGLIANSFGFLAGLRTSGLELQRAYEILIA